MAASASFSCLSALDMRCWICSSLSSACCSALRAFCSSLPDLCNCWRRAFSRCCSELSCSILASRSPCDGVVWARLAARQAEGQTQIPGLR